MLLAAAQRKMVFDKVDNHIVQHLGIHCHQQVNILYATTQPTRSPAPLKYLDSSLLSGILENTGHQDGCLEVLTFVPDKDSLDTRTFATTLGAVHIHIQSPQIAKRCHYSSQQSLLTLFSGTGW